MRDEATQRQVDAANPDANTWLSANAGSGKTRVLTDRVARLLLSGVLPQNVLCLTYTKAAASEMQNRLFKRLGAWAMLGNDELEAELAELGVDDPGDLARARRLFATAIETPGGLKVQTIHAFCAAILRWFPMEAGVSPDFKEMDDRSAKLLQMEIAEEMAEGPERPLVEELARYFSGAEFEKLLQEIAGKRLAFAARPDRTAIWGWFDLDPGIDEASLAADAFLPDDARLLQDLIGPLSAGSKTDQKAADKLRSLDAERLGHGDLPLLESVFLTGASAKEPFSAKIGSFPTKATQNGAASALMPRLENLMLRVEALRPIRLALGAARKTLALHRFAHEFANRYETRKARRGWLDFDDLIQRAAALLNQSDVAQWVLYRLDGGIDHILVDEAQDTSPEQWRVIDSLAREFMSGEGAHAGRDWSIFVVGDPKQSIYSFQGADPLAFADMRDRFEAGLGAIQRPLQRLPLEYSFRSAPVILEAVDTALRDLPGLGDAAPSHRAFQDAKPGRVDLWPMAPKVEDPEPQPWDAPLDVPSEEDHNVVLAEQIADEIARIVDSEQILGKEGWRPVTAGDIIVLVQRRSDLFHHIIRACKARNLPIAGADRLRIGGEMAVTDLTALLRFLATPEDDLSLASTLRSPLFRWSEDDLFRLAYGERSYLWAKLRDSEPTETLEILHDLRGQADFLRPYDLIDRVLTRHDGRRYLIGQLGHEAQDGIDALLAQALAYEQMEVPSLTGFLTWLDAEDVEIKRQMDSSAREIRVMTVHGSKGLEAPIVILPDTAKRPIRGRGDLVEMNGNMVWKPASAEMPPMLTSVTEAAKERDLEERMRLLYVAMTRAESWLIVAGAGDAGKEPSESWHGIVQQGLEAMGAAPCGFPTGEGLRVQNGDWPEPTVNEQAYSDDEVEALPSWTETHAPRPVSPPGPLTPSDLGGAKVLPGSAEALDGEAAKRRGRQIHRLLELLPEYDPADWPHHASALLAFGEDAAQADEIDDLLAEAGAVLSAPDLASLFSGTALAEVEISAPVSIAGRDRVHGIIDRLVITPERVLAVDFKSNQTVPTRPEDIPEGILRQLGAYEAALAPIYPDREIVSAVLWTRQALFMELPPGLALRAFRRLDAEGAAT